MRRKSDNSPEVRILLPLRWPVRELKSHKPQKKKKEKEKRPSVRGESLDQGVSTT